MKHPALLVFDWDGTLMDSEAQIVACMCRAADDMGWAPLDREAVREIIGLGLVEAVAALYPEHAPAEHRAMAERYRYHFLADDAEHSSLFAGAREVLTHCAGEGYLLAVATGKGRRGLDKVLDVTGLRALFHATRCADETHSKPHPRMLHEIMDELGVMPADTLVIGDTEFDMQMARNARATPLPVSYGAHDIERLKPYSPDWHLDSIGELTPLLQAARERL
ncbi:MAG TPA: HAD family hydrolase [Chromatiaceae bacterium]|nr:HAD family hydrolase [Chromatiaceae bacterium]